MAKKVELISLRDIIDQYGLSTEKRLGQHFILDQNLTDRIVRTAQNKASDLSPYNIIEIGSGPGVLTSSILQSKPKHLYAIELDFRCIEILNKLK